MPLVRSKNKTCEIPLRVIDIDERGCHLLVKISINKSRGHYFVLDTGASMTVLDKNLESLYQHAHDMHAELKSYALGENEIQTSWASIDEFRIGKVIIRDLKIVLVDLSGITEIYKQYGRMKISGLLGGDFLKDHKAVINYKKKSMKLYL